MELLLKVRLEEIKSMKNGDKKGKGITFNLEDILSEKEWLGEPKGRIKKVKEIIGNKINYQKNILVIHTGGGKTHTVANKAWKIPEDSNVKISILGYQDKRNPELCKLVNTATKAYIRGRNESVILYQNNSTLIENDSEFESLCVPF